MFPTKNEIIIIIIIIIKNDRNGKGINDTITCEWKYIDSKRFMPSSSSFVDDLADRINTNKCKDCINKCFDCKYMYDKYVAVIGIMKNVFLKIVKMTFVEIFVKNIKSNTQFLDFIMRM